MMPLLKASLRPKDKPSMTLAQMLSSDSRRTKHVHAACKYPTLVNDCRCILGCKRRSSDKCSQQCSLYTFTLPINKVC